MPTAHAWIVRRVYVQQSPSTLMHTRKCLSNLQPKRRDTRNQTPNITTISHLQRIFHANPNSIPTKYQMVLGRVINGSIIYHTGVYNL